MNIGSIVEAIDHQLALLWEVRELLTDEEPAGPQRKTAKKAVSPSRSAAVKVKSERAVPRKKSLPLSQVEINFDGTEQEASVEVEHVELKASEPEVVAAKAKPSRAIKAVKTPRVQKPKEIVVAAPSAPKALTSSIPAGPIVVKPALAAQEREARIAKAAPSPVPHTKPTSGLDALIEDAAARAGIKVAELRRAAAF